MNRRTQVISATVLMLLGVVMTAVPFLGGSSLHAAGFQTAGYDISRIILWAGLAILIISALLFVSASAD